MAATKIPAPILPSKDKIKACGLFKASAMINAPTNL